MGVPEPPRIAKLPKDKHGRPVPWFVAWIDGVPDHRVVENGKIVEALKFRRCFICGDELGRFATFPVGPMCTVNRTSPEPPSHKDCAVYSAMACPFLSTPEMKRGPRPLPNNGDRNSGPGLAILRNPGVTAIWTTRAFSTFRDPVGKMLFDIGEPEEVLWLAEGRAALRSEVLASFDGGLPILLETAEKFDGPEGVKDVHERLSTAMRFVPSGG